VGDHDWEDLNWNGQGHRTVVNKEDVKQYANQGSFQDVVVKMFWVSALAQFQISIISFSFGQI
jgi:hypothetical protein